VSKKKTNMENEDLNGETEIKRGKARDRCDVPQGVVDSLEGDEQSCNLVGTNFEKNSL